MRLRSDESQITVPAGVGLNLSADPESLNHQRRVASLVNLDTRYPGQWTKRLPIVNQLVYADGSALADTPTCLLYLKKADGTYYDIILDDDGNLIVQWYNSSNEQQGYDIVSANWLTDNIVQLGVQYRDKMFIFNGTDVLKFFKEGTSGVYTANEDYGNAGVSRPTGGVTPYIPAYSSDYISFKGYEDSDGGILGGLGSGIIQYRHVWEYENGALYGNPGAGGYSAHQFAPFTGANGYGQPVFEFQWFGRYQLESVIGAYYQETSNNLLVTAKVLCHRFKHYADEPFTSWERSLSRNTAAINSQTSTDLIWSDTTGRTGTPLPLNNDEPVKFLYGAIAGGSKGVFCWGNRQDQRPIPKPLVEKTDAWGTPTYRNEITIVNNSVRTYTRPTVRVLVNAERLEGTIRNITTTYADIVFTDSDGLTIWDCYVDPFDDGDDSYGAFDTQFDITNPSGTTFRYTYDGTGTAPLFVTNGLASGNAVVINSVNFNANNNGTFITTAVAETYFEITNAAGVAEDNKTIGLNSYIKLDALAFIVTPIELVAGQEAKGYIYYKSVPAGTEVFYGFWDNVLHPPYVESDQLFNSWCRERYFPPLSSGSDNDGFRNKVNQYDAYWTIGTLSQASWILAASRPYGMVTTQTDGNEYIGLTQDSTSVPLLWEDSDILGRVLDNATFEFRFRYNNAYATLAIDTVYEIFGYDAVGAPGGSYFIIAFYRETTGGGAFPLAPADGDWIRIDFNGGAYDPDGETKWVKVDTQDQGIVRTTATDASYWTYLALSFDASGNYNVIIAPTYSATPSDNWSNISYNDAGDTGEDQTFTPPMVEFGDGTGNYHLGKSGNVSGIAFPMYLEGILLTERYMSRRELMDRARDFTWHGATSLTDTSSQPTLSVSVSSTTQSTTEASTDATEIGWSKVNGEVFPTEYSGNLPEACTGVIEWQDDAMYFCENSIHKLVTTTLPEEWKLLKNIAQEAPSIGCIAPYSLTKTETAIIFMSNQGLVAFDGQGKPINLSKDLWRYWVDTYGIAALKQARVFYHPKEEQIFVTIPSTAETSPANNYLDKTFVFDWGKFSGSPDDERDFAWCQYQSSHSGNDYGARCWILRDGAKDNQDAYFGSGFSDNTIFKIDEHIYFGAESSQFDITRPGTPNANTSRYTWDTTGADPKFDEGLAVGKSIVINSPNFASGNNGTFTLTAVDTSTGNYFEITNAAGSAESNRVLGTDTALKCTASNVRFKDRDSSNSSQAVSWQVHTADILTDNADLNQVDIRLDQKQVSGTDRTSPAVSLEIYRNGSSNQTISNRTLSTVESIKPRTHVADSVQVRLTPDSSNDPTDQTRIKRIDLAVKAVKR